MVREVNGDVVEVIVNHGRTDVRDIRSVCVLCSCRDDDV
jgi:hypothetical protein